MLLLKVELEVGEFVRSSVGDLNAAEDAGAVLLIRREVLEDNQGIPCPVHLHDPDVGVLILVLVKTNELLEGHSLELFVESNTSFLEWSGRLNHGVTLELKPLDLLTSQLLLGLRSVFLTVKIMNVAHDLVFSIALGNNPCCELTLFHLLRLVADNRGHDSTRLAEL